MKVDMCGMKIDTAGKKNEVSDLNGYTRTV